MVTGGAARSVAVGAAVDLADVQGNILRGYRKAHVRHLVVRVGDVRRGRAWIAAASARDATTGPRITDGGHWSHPPATCFNVGITATGMRALGVPAAVVRTFPAPWQQGMAARAANIGDWGDSDPANWHERFRDPDAVHVIVSLHGDTAGTLDELERAVKSLSGGDALRVIGRDDGNRFAHGGVHFGYRDNIAQPRFEGITHPGKYDDQPFAPLGTVLLGYDTDMEELRWSLPDPAVLGFNGAFNAYRVLEQDVVAFEAFLDRAADEVLASPGAEELLPLGAESRVGGEGATRRAAMREVVAAKLMGRWRNGTPLAVSPAHPVPQPDVPTNDFDYVDDPQGMKCPYGSHIRRGNPRGGKIVQRVSNHTRRLVRRGFPYGPPYDPARPQNVERGLLGNFLCANLEAQFEAMMYDWMNLGLLDPRLLASNDPMVGANDEAASWFKLPTRQGTIVLRGIPRFVRTRGGAYTFLPGLSALRWIGSLHG
jgi:deferrochelatase/peroxidase EfeB